MSAFFQIGIGLSLLLLIIALLKKLSVLEEMILFGLTPRSLTVAAFYILLLMIVLVMLDIWKNLSFIKGGWNDDRHKGAPESTGNKGDSDKKINKTGGEKEIY